MSEPTKQALLLAIDFQAGIDRALKPKGVTLKTSAVPKLAKAIDHFTCFPELVNSLKEIVKLGGAQGQIATNALDVLARRTDEKLLDHDSRAKVAVEILALRGAIPLKGTIKVHLDHAKDCPMGRGKGKCICVPDMRMITQTGTHWTIADDGYPTPCAKPADRKDPA